MLAETLMELEPLIVGADGNVYRARACGRPREDGMWEGWVEFEDVRGEPARTHRTPRETTQPNRADLVYWATGLSTVFLEGALRRAMEPAPRLANRARPSSVPPAYEGPAEDVDASSLLDATEPARPIADPIVDPFEAFAKGEGYLRRKLGALDAWHLRNVARANRIVTVTSTLEELERDELVELIVAYVRGVAGGLRHR